jgi:deoxyribodipyrimidine photolyase-related protein
MPSLCLVVADQLFQKHPALDLDADFVMVESGFLSSKLNYHKFKLSYILTSMREYNDFLKESGRKVFYNYLDQKKDFESVLADLFKDDKYNELVICEIADKYFEKYLSQICDKLNIKLRILESEMFLTPKSVFKNFVDSKKGKRLLMNDFYIQQRIRLNILVQDNKPVGGKWSFDENNRKKLAKNTIVPDRQKEFESSHFGSVVKLINKHFPNNPGQISDNSWLPINFTQAEEYLSQFCQSFLPQFGDYEDAMTTASDLVFHSCLSTLLNNGLLTPNQVLDKVLNQKDTPINSLEGFVRQIIGWREWVKGLYDHVYTDNFLELNHFESKVNLPEYFYNTMSMQDTEYLNNFPLQNVLQKVDQLAYCHHIERLMILSNWMTLNQYKPNQCYNWFVEMFVDSSEWVMVANVMGMGLFADGGIFATKPYVAGGNYIKKMSDYPTGKNYTWEKLWTDKFWEFLMNNQQTFMKNPRMAMLIKSRLNKALNVD